MGVCCSANDRENEFVEPPVIRTVTARYDHEDHFKKHDLIYVYEVHKDADGKLSARGKCRRNGKVGYFPIDRVSHIDLTNILEATAPNPWIPEDKNQSAQRQHNKNEKQNSESKVPTKLSTIKSLPKDNLKFPETETDPVPITRNIFYTKTSLVVVAGYSRNIHPTITNRLPKEIIDLVWKFCIEPELIGAIKFGIIAD